MKTEMKIAYAKFPKRTKANPYILKKDIVIPAGTKLIDAPTSVKYHSKHFEALVGFGKDHYASIFFDEDLVNEFTDFFGES